MAVARLVDRVALARDALLQVGDGLLESGDGGLELAVALREGCLGRPELGESGLTTGDVAACSHRRVEHRDCLLVTLAGRLQRQARGRGGKRAHLRAQGTELVDPARSHGTE